MDMKTEAEIQAEILIGLGERYPHLLRAWRNNSGAVKVDNRYIKFGIKGQADISGILVDGRRLEIEVKNEKGRQGKDQMIFQKVIERFNGVYILARSFEDVRSVIDNYVRSDNNSYVNQKGE